MRSSPLVLVAAFCAASAGAEGGIRLSAAAYMNALRESSQAANDRMEAAQKELADLPPVAYFEAFRLEGLEALREVREEIEDIAVRPDDHGLRAEVLGMYAVVEQIFSESLPEAFELFSRERVRNADLARLEALMAHIEDAPQRAFEKLARAERAYVEANGWRLTPARAEPPEPEEPSFTAPGIPPAGSRLDGEVHVGFALRHRNEVLDLQNALVSSANRMMGATNADGATLEAARKQELEQVRSVLVLAQKLEAWQGDATLRDGLLACGRGLERAFDRPMRAFAKAVAKGFETQKQVDAANARIAEINQAVQSAMQEFSGADARFGQRWAFDAYAAWQEAQPKREPRAPQRERDDEGDAELPSLPEPAGPPA